MIVPLLSTNGVFTPEEMDEINALPHLCGPDYEDKILTLKSGRIIRQWMWKRRNECIDRVAPVEI